MPAHSDSGSMPPRRPNLPPRRPGPSSERQAASASSTKPQETTRRSGAAECATTEARAEARATGERLSKLAAGLRRRTGRDTAAGTGRDTGTATAEAKTPRRASSSRLGTAAESRDVSAASARRVSTRGHLQVSWMFLTLVAIVLVGAFALSPTVALLLDQRAEIDTIRAEIDQTNAEIDEMQREAGNWSDPAYVRAQARERLFYVMPGEQAFTVIDDREGVIEVDDTSVTSTDLVTRDVDWATVGLRSVIMAGVTELTPEQLSDMSVVVEE